MMRLQLAELGGYSKVLRHGALCIMALIVLNAGSAPVTPAVPLACCSKCDRVFKQHQMPSKCEEEECPAFNLRKRPGV
jgi:hypothetical protein